MGKPGILLSVWLSACASAPAYRAPSVPVPQAFRETEDTIVKVPTPPTLVADTPSVPELGDTTLTRLMKQAVGGNLDVRSAEARVRAARATRNETRFDLAPTVTFAGGYTRERISAASFPIAAGSFPDRDVWDAGFDAAWELDVFGRVRKNVQAQGAALAANEEDLRNVQVSLIAELARSYFELRGAQEQLMVAHQNAENQRRTLELTQERLDAGKGTAFDTERAQAQLSFTLASIPSLESAARSAEYQIAVLIGQPPAAIGEELERLAPLPTLPLEVSVASPDSIVRRRPDVAFAERQLAVQRALVGSAKADYLPRILLGGSAGYTASQFDGIGDNGTFRYAVGPVVTWPALNLGRVKARVDVFKAQQAEAQSQYDQTVLRALQEVESSLVRYRTARSRVDRIQEAALASERAADLARLRFAGGVADFLQVLDAERTQLDAQNQLAQGRTEAATAYAALYKALGGLWPGANQPG